MNDDDGYDEYDVVRCITMFDDWNSLFGKFWGSSGLAVMLSDFCENHGLSIIFSIICINQEKIELRVWSFKREGDSQRQGKRMWSIKREGDP